MADSIYSTIINKKEKREKQFAILIDPDMFGNQNGKGQITKIAEQARLAGVDYFFAGGSILTNGNIENCIKVIKENCSIPVVLFPGNILQIHNSADAILFLSLISGRNAELLIGNHVIAAPLLKTPEYSGLEVLPTGYMLIERGNSTTASYMSNTIPIPGEKNDVAVCTAIAGEMLGLRLIYMDGGSGALNPITETMIRKVSESISVPLITGGGIRTPEDALKSCKAGADVIVVGNAIEKDVSLVKSISEVVHSA